MRKYGTLFLREGGNLEQSRLLACKRDGSDLKKPVALIRGDRTGYSSLAHRGRKTCPPPLIQDNVVHWLEDDPRLAIALGPANGETKAIIRLDPDRSSLGITLTVSA